VNPGLVCELILTSNLRRNLDAGQRGIIVLEAAPILEAAAKKRQLAAGERGKEGGRGNKKTLPANSPEGYSGGEVRDQLAAMAGVVSPLPIACNPIHRRLFSPRQPDEPHSAPLIASPWPRATPMA
jgi:hypothetical protein